MTWVEEAEREAPYAEIRRVGRWTYHVEVHHGMMVETPGAFVLGRRRAENKARRMLASYLRRQQRSQDRRVVRLEP